ncbi:MAG: polyphosphate kinase 2 family protein, partial [Marinirhabdus sp.]
MKKALIEDYKVTAAISLKNRSTRDSFSATKKELKKGLENVREQLGELQDTLYAHGKYAVLVCLQGMDTAGKDSLIREVFKDFNVRGVTVHSFKVPTPLEKAHDYLWRHYIALPARGKVGVFNRTHYENVLVTRVHPEYILGENLPGVNTLLDIDDGFWDKRFQQINNFEKTIA